MFRSHLTRRVKCDKTAKTLTKAHPADYLSFIGAHSMEGPTREKWRQTRPACAKQREWQTIVPNSPRKPSPAPASQLHQHSDIQTPTKKRAALFFIYHARFGRGTKSAGRESLTRSAAACDSFAHFFRFVHLT